MKSLPWMWVAAIAVGIVAGLAFAWLVPPQSQPDTAPRSLRADYKDQWREAVAASYAVTGDLPRARARLDLMADADAIQALTAQAQQALASGRPFEVAQDLARLAADLQTGASSVTVRPPAHSVVAAAATATRSGPLQPTQPPAPLITPSPGTPSATTATLFPTPSPVASPTPMSSPTAPFRLVSQDEVCDPSATVGLLRITILDAAGNPLPGIEITVTWAQGADRFFTGLQPEISPGYADYTMKGGTTYSVQVARLGFPVSGLAPPICTSENNQPYLGGLSLTFAAP